MALIDNNLLDSVTAKAKESERLRMNHNFHSSLDSKAQKLLNALEPGTILPIHRHRHTSETYILLRGRIRVMFYDNEGKEEESFDLDPLTGNYGIDITAGRWHTLEVLESGSVIFEVKEGPYMALGAEDVMSAEAR